MTKEFFRSSQAEKHVRFTDTVRIERPAGVAFDCLADLRNLPAWNYAIRETRSVTPEPAGLGSVYQRLRSLPRPMREQLEIIECERDHRLGNTAVAAITRQTDDTSHLP